MKRANKILFLCMVILVLCTLAMPVSAADSIFLPEQNSNISGDGWNWDAETKTLTLNNISITGSKEEPVIAVPDGTTVVLADGTVNTITAYGKGQMSAALLCYGSLTIKGDGKLNTSNGFFGVFANSGITIDSSTINIEECEYGIYANNEIVINDSNVVVNGLQYGIHSNQYSIEIANSEITATGGEHAIYSKRGEVEITDSKVNASGGDTGICGEVMVNISGSQIVAAATEESTLSVGIFGGAQVRMSDSNVMASGKTEAMMADDDIMLKDVEVQNGAVTAKRSNYVGTIELAEIIFTDKNGNALKEVTITAKKDNPFTDIISDDYFYDAVLWALDKGVTTGLTETTFGPQATCTRAQAVTFLWRAMGSPEPASTENPFTDVAASDYFYKPVLWAVEQGITNGTSATTFSPNDTVTRGHTITFLYRAMGKPVAEGNLSFGDVPADVYYYDPVLWATNNGVAPTSGNKFYPTSDCPRAQIVYFIYNALN